MIEQSVQLTLRQGRALIEDEPVGWSGRQVRNGQAWLSRYEVMVRAQQRERYGAALEQIHEQQQTVAGRLRDGASKVEGIRKGVSSGRVSSEQGQNELTAIFRCIKQDREVLDTLDSSAARAVEMINQDPADYQEGRLRRFPMLKQSLPELSEAWLNGDDNRDPFDGG